jgi:hypothetical protein
MQYAWEKWEIINISQKMRRPLNIDRDDIRTDAKDNVVWECIFNSAGSRYSEVTGYCEHENEV